MPARGVFPTIDNCDPTDPEEFALWAFAALPHQNGGQFIMPIEYFRLVSKRLWDLGFRQVEEPTLEYVPPSANDPNWATSAGRWEPVGTVTEDEKHRNTLATGIALMGHQQKVEFFKALEAWEAGEDLPDTEAGTTVARMLEQEPHLLPLALEVLRDSA